VLLVSLLYSICLSLRKANVEESNAKIDFDDEEKNFSLIRQLTRVVYAANSFVDTF
jgi:hypothetical protein